MDESFTYIDDLSAEKILTDIFKFIGQEKSLIYITRNIGLLSKFDRIYYFKGGKIVESGSWKELLKEKGLLYQEYVEQSNSNE